MRRSLIAVAALMSLTGVAVADDTRPLRMEAVDHVIEQNDRAVQACGRGARRDTLAVMMRLDIDPEGQVLLASPAVEKAPAEAACLARVARRMKFPKAGVVSHVEYPFLIAPQLRR